MLRTVQNLEELYTDIIALFGQQPVSRDYRGRKNQQVGLQCELCGESEGRGRLLLSKWSHSSEGKKLPKENVPWSGYLLLWGFRKNICVFRLQTLTEHILNAGPVGIVQKGKAISEFLRKACLGGKITTFRARLGWESWRNDSISNFLMLLCFKFYYKSLQAFKDGKK